MKKIILAALILSLSHSAAQAAQRVLRPIGGQGDWLAGEIADHALWRKDACLAYTKAGDGTALEIYAERLTEEQGSNNLDGANYIQPTIQIVTHGAPSYVRGIMTDKNGQNQVLLMLAATKEPTPAFGLVSRIDDRKKILDLLKSGVELRLSLINQQNRRVGNMEIFSPRGAANTINAVFSACGLAL